MRHTILVTATVLLFSTTLSASAESQRYLIATSRPLGVGAAGSILRELRQGVSPAELVPLKSFQGFAAELTESEAAMLRRSGDVRWVEPVIERHALAVARNHGGQTVPYGIDLVHAREAWNGQRSGVVNVAVLDTGVDFRHPDLGEIYAGGFNFYGPASPPLDDAGHGTHVAGTIAASDNSIGVVGIAPQAQTRLWGVKVLNSSGSGTTESVIKGIDWVLDKKAEAGGNWIINLSLGSTKNSPAEHEAVNRALDAGILIVAASGNESTEAIKAAVLYPAAYEGVVAVGAVDETETVANFSNQGPELDLSAPGVAILSTIPIGTNFVGEVRNGTTTWNANPLELSDPGIVTGEFVYCGLGHPDQFPPSVRGRIALIKRGELTFAAKTRNAVDAGAVAVIIFNHNTTSTNWTLRSDQDTWSATYDFPMVLALTKDDGEALLQKEGVLALTSEPDDYAFYSGTSMATPHVAGAAALVWSMAPAATAKEVVQALTATAIDRGPRGLDAGYGAGVVNVLAAARHLAPKAFPSAPSAGPSTGRPIGKRGRG